MVDIELVLNGRYETRDGTIIKIVSVVSKDSPARIKGSAPCYTEEELLNKGYELFRADTGDTYFSNGEYDANEETALDIVKQVVSQYMVNYKVGVYQLHFAVEAADPLAALKQFKQTIFYYEDVIVFECIDVTPIPVE